MRAQASKTGKGSAGEKPRGAFKYVSPEEKARKKLATMQIAARKPGQRAGMAKTRAAAKKAAAKKKGGR